MRLTAMKWLPLAAAGAVAVVVTAVALATRDNAPTPEPKAAEPELWTGTATLLQTDRAGLTLCGGAITLSLPPSGCGGATVLGLDPMTVPGAHRYPNGTITTPSVRLVGTWDGNALTVTEKPVLAEPPAQAEPTVRIPGPSCEEPAGGWPFDKVDIDGMGRVQEYAERQPDAGIPRVDSSQRILTVPFTGDLDRHRSEIARLYDGPVCVELTEHSAREMQSAAERAEGDVKARGLKLLSADRGSIDGHVSITVVAATPEEMSEIEATYDGMLRLRSFLTRA